MEAEKTNNNHPPSSDRSATTSTKPPPSEPSRRRGKKRKKFFTETTAPPAAKRHARERAAAAATTAAAAAAAAAAAEAAAVKEAVVVKEETVAKEEDLVVVVTENVDGDNVAVDEEDDEGEGLEVVAAKVEAEFEAVKNRDKNVHVVPIPAGWFSWTGVHPVEKQTLPSFFNGKSEKRTPEVYIEIRDWIMRKFHADPNTQIEVKDLSEISVGEMDARQEVMEFLDHWGLINYHPFPESDNSLVKNDDKLETANSMIDILYRFEREESRVPVVARDTVATPTVPAVSNLFPETTVVEELVRQEEPEYHCNSCSADCSRKRYHCQIQADYDLCTECFSSGKFEDMSPADFILMEPAEAAGGSGGKWTDQETLLLLEAVELFSENWNEIADHVATKTKAQCILHFIQMPIEESVMDRDDEKEATNEDVALSKTENDTSAPKDASETTNGEINVDNINQPEPSPMEVPVLEDASGEKVGEEANQNIALKALNEAFEVVGFVPNPGGQFSFAEAGNPAMALAAFLVRLAEPKVTTAATHSSLKCIADKSSSIDLAARHCFILEDPPGDKNTPAEVGSIVAEAMEVDAGMGEEQNKENGKHEILDPASKNVDVPMKTEDGSNEKEAPSFPKSKRKGKLKMTKKLDSSESDKADLHKVEGTENTKNKELAPEPETHPNSLMVPVDNETEPKHSVANESTDVNQKVEIPSSSVKEPADKPEEPSEHTVSEKEENAAPGALTSEVKEVLVMHMELNYVNGDKLIRNMRGYKVVRKMNRGNQSSETGEGVWPVDGV